MAQLPRIPDLEAQREAMKKLGFLAEADQNIRNVDGQPITPPQSGQFITYALTKGDVPDMWVTYNVLAS